MKPLIFLAFGSALLGVAFLAGRIVATPSVVARTADPAPPTEAARPAGTANRAIAADPIPLRYSPVAIGPDLIVEQAPLEETAEATAARRAEADQHLTQQLGNITGEQRRMLLDVNDRAIELQRRLAGELQRGTIDHEDYMRQIHEGVVAQLDELTALVSDDQYRVLTGLEPGVDPFEFMISGVGAAERHAQIGGAL